MISELEETNGSFPKENSNNPLPSSVGSFASEFQSPDFVSMMPKALLPTVVDGVKHSLSSPAFSESHGSNLNDFPVCPPVTQKEILCPARPLGHKKV